MSASKQQAKEILNAWIEIAQKAGLSFDTRSDVHGGVDALMDFAAQIYALGYEIGQSSKPTLRVVK